MLQKYTKTPKNLYCTFYSLVGHDDNHCHALDMMMERTQNVYVMQSEQHNHPTGGAQHDPERGGYEGQEAIEAEEGVEEHLAKDEDRSSVIIVDSRVTSHETIQ